MSEGAGDIEPATGTTGTGQASGYRVLARKYRPRDFSDLIGQAPMVRTLTNAFATGRIAQAYMLTGVRGVGKTTTARILARALNYKTAEIDRPTIDLGTLGEHCQAIMEGRHVDVIEMDAASHTGIDDIREIIEQVRYRPVSARYKVYIIDEVHMLSTQAFNGLLKTLEEPPEHVKFIFATTEIRKVPITVLSRCQRFDLRRIDAGLLVNHFRGIAAKENVSIDDESLTMIARAAEGSVRDGLSLMDQAIAHGGSVVEADTVRGMLGLADRSRIVDLFRHVAAGDVVAALKEYQDQYDGGASPAVVLTDLADFTHLVTRLKFVPEAAEDAALTEAERLGGAEMAGRLSVPTLSRLWQMLLKGISETEGSSRPAGAAEMVLIRLTHAASLPSPEDAARQLARLTDGDPAPAPARAASSTSASAGPSGSTAAGRGATSASTGPGSSNASAAVAATGTARPVASASSAGSTGPALRAVASSSAQATAEPDGGVPVGEASTAMSPAAPAAASAPEAHATTPGAAIRTLADIAALADQHRDITTKIHVRKYLRPVRIAPGRLEVSLTDDAPKTLLGTLPAKLEAWTGMRWIVMLSRDPGAETLEEIEAARREALVVDARQDPDVAAILARFPGARIADVKIRADALEDLPQATESDEGDILPDSPEDLE